MENRLHVLKCRSCAIKGIQDDSRCGKIQNVPLRHIFIDFFASFSTFATYIKVTRAPYYSSAILQRLHHGCCITSSIAPGQPAALSMLGHPSYRTDALCAQMSSVLPPHSVLCMHYPDPQGQLLCRCSSNRLPALGNTADVALYMMRSSESTQLVAASRAEAALPSF